MVVLDHLLSDPELGDLVAAVGLDEEAPLVAEQLRLDEPTPSSRVSSCTKGITLRAASAVESPLPKRSSGSSHREPPPAASGDLRQLSLALLELCAQLGHACTQRGRLALEVLERGLELGLVGQVEPDVAVRHSERVRRDGTRSRPAVQR